MTPLLPNRRGQNAVVVSHDLAPEANADHQTIRACQDVLRPLGIRILKRAAAGLALLFLAYGLPACSGIGESSFSGGGVPIGGSRLFGRVVSAADTSTSLSNVTVTVQATPQGGVERDLTTTTGKDGSFNFSNVLPGFSNGHVQITATPDNTNYRPAELAFNISNGRTEQMIVTLPPSSFDPTTAQSVSIAIASPAVPAGGSVQFQAVVRDAAGQALPVSPTLVFDGNFGTLNTDNTFSVPAGVLSGSGSITAFWYNLLPQSQPIHVDKNASPQPPQPPVLPKSQELNK